MVGIRTEWPWRDTREMAVLDAIDDGLAERDEYTPSRLYWHPLARIEAEESPSHPL